MVNCHFKGRERTFCNRDFILNKSSHLAMSHVQACIVDMKNKQMEMAIILSPH